MKTLLCVQVLFGNSKIYSDISEAEMDQREEKAMHPFFDRCSYEIKCFFVVSWDEATQFQALKIDKRKHRRQK